jgi:hypothetical protein
MPFEQAVEEVWFSQKTRVEESTLRGHTHRYGKIAEEIAEAEAARIEKEMPESAGRPEKILVSVDGAFIHLTSGEWREVKTMVVGEIETEWEEEKEEKQVKTRNISYFSHSCRIREFERLALAELQRRGVFNAEEVVTVNDGADWTQSFADYHFPQATRVLDFRHATDYLVTAGQAALGEGTAPFKSWLERMTHQLKHDPPQQTLDDIRLLPTATLAEASLAVIDQAYHYLDKRKTMIDYAHFRERGWPIGSGSVESSHKVVVHSRLKQAGMRWAQQHVDPMLALRNLICNDRWSEGWSQIVFYYWQQRHQEFRELAQRQRPHLAPLPSQQVALKPRPTATPAPASELLPKPTPKQELPHRPAPDHPWRRGIWPSRVTRY